MYFKQHYEKFDECSRCHRRYLEINLIANYNSSRKRCDSFCIRCYNGRDKYETKETINETLQRRIKKALREPRTLRELAIRKKWDRVKTIVSKRYDLF